MSPKKIFVILADGFEEIEAMAPVDILRRLGFDVCLVGLSDKMVKGAHNITVQADLTLETADFNTADAIVLPGGMPGATNLRNSSTLITHLVNAANAGKVVAAICAAPIVLERAGLTKNKRITGYPGSEKMTLGLQYTGNIAEADGNIITGKGPGAAFAFAEKIAVALGKTYTEVRNLFAGMFIS